MSSASTTKITAKTEDGTENVFFMKTGKGKDAEVMFEGPKSVPQSQERNISYVISLPFKNKSFYNFSVTTEAISFYAITWKNELCNTI